MRACETRFRNLPSRSQSTFAPISERPLPLTLQAENAHPEPGHLSETPSCSRRMFGAEVVTIAAEIFEPLWIIHALLNNKTRHDARAFSQRMKSSCTAHFSNRGIAE